MTDHGTYRGYAKDRCRCDACKLWKSQDNLRSVNLSKVHNWVHGVARTYRYGCRCDDCKAAKKIENSKQNPKRALEVRSERSLKKPKSYVEYRLKTKYGLTLDDYNRRLDEQNGTCAICDQSPDKGRLVVDHSHVTGEVRGLLCNSCNLALGLARDNPELLRKMAAYLD